MKKFIFSLLVVSSAVFGNNQSSISSFVLDKYLDMGSYYANLKKDDLAIKSYTKAIEINPHDADTYFYRGNSYYELKNYSLAIKDYTKAIELNPNYAATYYNRGLSYMNLKKDDLAIKSYTKAIELNPNDSNGYINRGVSYYKLKKYDLAIKNYTKAIELNSSDSLAYVNLLEMSIVRNQKFDKSLEEQLITLTKDDKLTSCEYEILRIIQSIGINKLYNLTPTEWDAKYKNIKIEDWDFEELDEWANATKDNEKKDKLQNAIKVFKEHGEGKK